MGYTTNYFIKAIDLKPSAERPKLDKNFFNSIGLYDNYCKLYPYGDLRYAFEEDCKWYNHDDEMIELSNKYQDIVFILDGEGKDQDVWRSFYLNGQIVHEWHMPLVVPPEWEDIK